MIAALFVETNGAYFNQPDTDPWDVHRDARKYAGPHPVIAHPPCHLWVNLAAVNWKRYQRQKPAWYPGGDDDGCFASALASVRQWGGVLEHPAFSHAWRHFGLPRPQRGLWIGGPREWVTEVWQSAYGHKARKRTWLFYCGSWPPSLNWSPRPGTHQVGWFDRNKPTLGKKAANATPPAFRDELIRLAKHSGG
jgi:hypothetical protein